MASKRFSLKDNPIFQSTEVPEPKSPAVIAEPEETPKPYVDTPENPPKEPVSNEIPKEQLGSVVKTTIVENTTPQESIQVVTNYYRMDNEVSDRLASRQSPTEHMIYHRLNRLSYGFQKDTCEVSIRKLQSQLGLGSDKTIQKAISGLIEKGHILKVGAKTHDPKGGSSYRVLLPCDILPEESRTRTSTGLINGGDAGIDPSYEPADGDDINSIAMCIREEFFENTRLSSIEKLVDAHGRDQVQLAMDVLNFQWTQSKPPRTTPLAVLKSILIDGVDVPEGFITREQTAKQKDIQRKLEADAKLQEQERQKTQEELRGLRDDLTVAELETLREQAEQRIADELGLKPGNLGFTKMLVKAKEDELLKEQYQNM